MIKKKYFKVVDGPLMDKLKDISNERLAYKEKVGNLVKELGEFEALVSSCGSLIGLEFKDTENLDMVNCWKSSARNAVMPRKSTKQGKALVKKIKPLEYVTDFVKALEVVGLSGVQYCVFCGDTHIMSSTGLRGDVGKAVFLTIPYLDSEGFTYNIPEHFKEVKEWEMLKELE